MTASTVVSAKSCCQLACAVQTPAVFVSQYQSAASFSTKSCQLSVNTTDSFSKVLYSGGADVTYASVQDFITALTSGDFVMGMTPSEQFVQVALAAQAHRYQGSAWMP